MTNPAKKIPPTPVEVGQLWIDNDRRLAVDGRKRYIRVTEVGEKHAVCQAWYDEAGSDSRTVRILLSRFRPISTGYRLAADQTVGR